MFVTGWLGFAIQPCVAMDHSTDGADAGHLAPAGDMHQRCPHCPPVPDQDAGCDQGAALACGAVDAPVLPSKDLSTAQPDLVLLSGFVAFQLPSIENNAARARQPDTARWRPPAATLQQRFCTFLK